jgi:hypothetical protein
MITARKQSYMDSHPVLKKIIITAFKVLAGSGGIIFLFSRDIIYMAIGLGLCLIAVTVGGIAYYFFDIELK